MMRGLARILGLPRKTRTTLRTDYGGRITLHGDGKRTSDEMLNFNWDVSIRLEEQRDQLLAVLTEIMASVEPYTIRSDLDVRARDLLDEISSTEGSYPGIRDAAKRWDRLKEAVDAYHVWIAFDKPRPDPFVDQEAEQKARELDGARCEACVHIRGLMQHLEAEGDVPSSP